MFNVSFLLRAVCRKCKVAVTRNDGSPTNMKNHLQNYHPELYNQYLKKVVEANKSKVEEIQMTRELEEEVEQTQSSIAEVTGNPDAIRKRPITAPITKYFQKGAPSKYLADSEFQRRADLELGIYFVTANVSFKHIESAAFRR